MESQQPPRTEMPTDTTQETNTEKVPAASSSETPEEAAKPTITTTKPNQTITIRGKPVSGKVWKTTQTKRHSSMKPKTLRPGWQKQMEERKHREMVKTIEKELKDEKAAEKKKKREAEKERLKRKEENEKRAEVVQKISAAKVKRMKKKQLRQLQKR